MKLCKGKKDKTTESPQEQRAADARLRGRLNKATEKVEPEPDGLNKIRARTDAKGRKGKKKR